MSKRSGEFVTLRDLVDEVGVDAARYFFLSRKGASPLDFDVELAKKQSSENPVYYVQYAHARIASILRKAGDGATERAEKAAPAAPGVPVEVTPSEPPAVTPTPTPQATGPACVDASPPESRFRRVQLDRRVLRAQGTAADVIKQLDTAFQTSGKSTYLPTATIKGTKKLPNPDSTGMAKRNLIVMPCMVKSWL